MKECPKPNCVASAIAKSDNFCYRCGTVLRERPACCCGYQFSKADEFCPKCGAKKQVEKTWREFAQLKAEEERDRQ